ncbi:uncharacterized protein [Bombus fervidus]|uniref:uncharacterized protein n=1 Tax=Bombus fervidus TaxID=203811 RepID=UPI003AB587CF
MFPEVFGMLKSDQLNGFLEKFKETMEEGDENLGIPVLEPFVSKRLDINLNEDGLFSATGRVKDLRIDGLSNYRVKRVDFPMAGFKAIQSNFSVPLRVKKLKATTDLQLEIRQGRLYVSNLELQTRVRKSDCDVSRLYVNDDLSENISETISEEAPNFLEEYQNQISQYVSNIVRNLMNNILRNYTLLNLLDMIGG